LPHLRLPDIVHSELILVRSKSGVKINIESDLMGSLAENEPITAFFFLASPDANPGQHLRILAQIASHVDDDKFILNWNAATNEQELKELLLRDDRYLSLLLKADSKTASLIGQEIKNLKLPEGTLIALIHRSGEIIVPLGDTVLNEFDRLTIVSYPEGIQELYRRYCSS
jgi:APA family basic amino acid/polyamine antiporter